MARTMLKRGEGGLLFRKIRKMRKDFDGRTQDIRGSLIAQLEELAVFTNKRLHKVRSEKNRQKWARIIAYIAQTITYIAGAYDVSEVDVRLGKLERMFRELKRAKKNGSSGKGT